MTITAYLDRCKAHRQIGYYKKHGRTKLISFIPLQGINGDGKKDLADGDRNTMEIFVALSDGKEKKIILFGAQDIQVANLLKSNGSSFL